MSIVLGIVLLLNPVLGAAVLPWVLGILALIGRVAAIVTAFRAK